MSVKKNNEVAVQQVKENGKTFVDVKCDIKAIKKLVKWKRKESKK